MKKHTSSNKRGGVSICWFLLVLLVACSFVGTLVQISKGLHEQLIMCKSNLFSLRDQLITVGDEKIILLDQKKDEESKSVRLRDKSQTVLDELLDQQKKVKALQYELLEARDDLNGMIENCTGSSSELRTQFNLTLDVLQEKVTSNMQYRSLLKRAVEDKIKVEGSLETAQYSVFNLTQELTKSKTELSEAAITIQKQKEDLDRMQDQVKKANEAMNHAAQLLKSKS